MMRVEIEWTRRARRDVLEIGDFIARDKPMAAAGWIETIISSTAAAFERAATTFTLGKQRSMTLRHCPSAWGWA